MSLKLSEVVAVVLAGGFGTRVKHLLPDLPKPMAVVAGRPFLEWVVRYLARQGVTRVVLSTGHLAEIIERHFARQPVGGVTVSWVAETKPLGTAGGFLNAARANGARPPAWLVLNGDSLAFANLARTAEQMTGAVAGVLVGCEVADASRFGTLRMDANRRLLGFEEKRPGSGVINAGIYLLRHELLNEFPAGQALSFETDVFPALTTRRKILRVQVVNAPFLDIGTPDSLAKAEEFISQNRSEFAAEDRIGSAL